MTFFVFAVQPSGSRCDVEISLKNAGQKLTPRVFSHSLRMWAWVDRNGQARRAHRRKNPQQWLALIPEAHEGYIGWQEFQKTQQMLAENVQGWGRRGAVKRGTALLGGLLRCRRCGRKLVPVVFLKYPCFSLDL